MVPLLLLMGMHRLQFPDHTTPWLLPRQHPRHLILAAAARLVRKPVLTYVCVYNSVVVGGAECPLSLLPLSWQVCARLYVSGDGVGEARALNHDGQAGLMVVAC